MDQFDEFVNKMLERKISTQEWVVDLLRQAILQGYFKDGKPIDTLQLANKLGVSRMPIRLALIQLENEGLVTLKPHKKAVASKLSPNEIRKIYQVRFELEGLAIRLAIPRISDADLERLADYIQEMDEAESINDFISLNNEFHNLIYNLSGNEFLINFIRQLRNNVERYLRLYVSERANMNQANNEHKEILKAIREKDESKAEELLRMHLTRTCETVAKNLEKFS